MAVDRTQYRLVQAVPLIPTGIAFILSYFCPETPRYLVSKKHHSEGLNALARLRGKPHNDPDVVTEFEAIDAQVRERSADLESVSHWAMFKETQTNPNYRQRFWLIMVMQTIGQWTGGNGITYYVTSIFQVCQRERNGIFSSFFFPFPPFLSFLSYWLLTCTTVRWPHRRCRIPRRLWRLRSRETCLHHGLHVGIN